MKDKIDCLIIGHNEVDFTSYKKTIDKMGKGSGAFRDLNLNYVTNDNNSYLIRDLYNKGVEKTSLEFFTENDVFSPAIAYLASFLNKRGYKYDFINSFQEEKQDLKNIILEKDILCIAITTTLYLTPFPIIEIINFIKKYNNETLIVVGGPFISNQVKALESENLNYVLESIGADFYVNSSQGESTLIEIIDSIKYKKDLKYIQNTYYVHSKKVNKGPIIEEDNLISDNPVDWTLFNNKLGNIVNIRTSISCCFRCSFCRYPDHAGKFQAMHIDVIEKELNLINSSDNIKSVYFIDDTFNFPVKRFREILKMMIKNKYSFKWHSYIRCQYLDKEIIDMMEESGCEGVYLGLESGDNHILENMNKNVTVEKYYKGLELLRNKDIMTFGSFIIGFPGETQKSVDRTIDLIKKSGIDFYRIHQFYLDSFVPIHKIKNNYNLKGKGFEWKHDTMDSNTAADIVEETFLNINNPIWIPQYSFNCDGFWHLIHKGISMENMMQFLTNFNNAVREKIRNPNKSYIEKEIFDEIFLPVLRDKSILNDNNINSIKNEIVLKF